jgi:hypothetical protein
MTMSRGKVITAGIIGLSLVGYGCIQYDAEVPRGPAPPAGHTATTRTVVQHVTRTVVQHAAPVLSSTDLVIVIVVIIAGIVGGIAVYMNGSRWRHLSR